MKIFVAISLLSIILFMSKTINSHDFAVPISCVNDESCRQVKFLPSNAICKNTVCICNEGGVVKNCTAPNTMLASTKISGAIIGRRCKHPIDCKLDHGYCNSTMSQCLCKHEYVSNNDGNKCLPIVNTIGGTCEDNKQCLAKFQFTSCSHYQCLCIDGFHYVDRACFKNAGIGETCKNTQECSHNDHSECNKQNICVCSVDSVLDSDNKRCLPIARELSQHCDESTQCNATLGINAECFDNHCRCIKSTHFVSKIHQCLINKHVGEVCESDDDCYQDELSTSLLALKCVNTICTCADGFIQSGNKCIVNTASATLYKISVSLLIFSLLIVGQ